MFVIFDYREIKKKNRVNVEADYSSSQNWHNSWSYFTMNHSNPLCKLYVIFIIVAIIITYIITVVLLHPCSSLWLCWSRLSSSWRWWSSFTSLLLTLSCHSLSDFRAEWRTHAPANSILSGPITSVFNSIRFDGDPFTWQYQREDKGLRVSNFAFLLVVFK